MLFRSAGYLLVGFLVGTAGGVEAVMYYLVVYLFANLAAFAVVIARERETDREDDVEALRGLSAVNPVLAGVMTLAMLSLAGIPATAGFIGKFNLISAAVDGGESWLGIVIVVGSMISLAYYLPVIAVMWGGGEPLPVRPRDDPRTGLPALAGAAPDADELSIEEPVDAPARAGIEVTIAAALLGLTTLVFGIVPQPLFDLVDGAARGLGLS